MTQKALVFGDPHGDFSSVSNAASRIDRNHPPLCIFLGDFDLPVSLEKAVDPLTSKGCEVVFVHGNHEADRVDWHDRVFCSGISHMNLDGKVLEVGGLRIAGLGGVFKGRIWYPKDVDAPARFTTRADFLAAHPERRWRGGLPLDLRATIFPEDYFSLSGLEADILVTHEAPSSHRYGFVKVDHLARAMGAGLIIHGHQHEHYEAELQDGTRVLGAGRADVIEVDLAPFRRHRVPPSD